MFARVFSLFMAVILLVAGVLTGLSIWTLRNEAMNARLENLMQEGEEIAFLAAQSTRGLLGNNTTYLSRKATQVYERYGAYILVVDRQGRVMDNMTTAYRDNPAFVASLSTLDINEALIAALGGSAVSVRSMVEGNPAFTVCVPFVENGVVRGVVLIQTPAQRVENLTDELLIQVMIVALAAIAVSAIGVFLVVRSVLKPLKAVQEAAGRMSAGDYTARVSAVKGPGEMTELATTFNDMAEQISETETSRREFVANVSHELRSPITSISGYVQGMADGTIPETEYGRYLSIVSGETKRLTKLIGDLLALSRLEQNDTALHLTNFDLAELFRKGIIRRVNDIEARKMTIDCDFEADTMLVHADEDRMEQVVVNLLDNAIKFTPDGGHITLRLMAEGGKCIATVADDGIGVLPEDRPRIFERFFTADRAHTAGKGTGLGLSISQRILQMHGERIWLENTEKGAAFSFSLPMAER